MQTQIQISVHNDDGCIWDKVAAHFGQDKLDILEVGVYKAAQIGDAYSRCNVQSYTGVDPYFGDAADPYRGSYWKDEVDSFKIYRDSKAAFERYGGGGYCSEPLLKSISEVLGQIKGSMQF